jgi:outer membrane protein assembly factor BamB
MRTSGTTGPMPIRMIVKPQKDPDSTHDVASRLHAANWIRIQWTIPNVRYVRAAKLVAQVDEGFGNSGNGSMKRSSVCFITAVVFLAGADLRAENVYSPGGWATLHRGPANRKLVPDVKLADDYRVWTALEGSAVLTAPTMSPDGRTLYVTTGRAVGNSNLHAFDLDGELLWKSEPWQDPSRGVDPCAILSSAIVDNQGDVYIGDCNQLFAFRPDGSVKWTVPLPSIQEGDWNASEAIPINALTTAVFTREGHVLGVTNAGDVIVVDRATGRSLAEPMRLPGLVPALSTTVPMPESVFSEGLVDPEIREWAWQLLFGGAMRSANSPGVDLDSGRIFVAATSTNEGKGALYALDLIPHDLDGTTFEVSIAYATEMGPGSGSSPSLSPARDAVYVSDEVGMFYAADAESGDLRWQVQTKSTSAAAAVGVNGDIYSLQAYGPALVAITSDGRIRWQSDLQALADAALPSSWLLGDPVAIGNGNPTVVGDVVLVPVAYGYETTLGRRIPWLVQSSLVAIDAETGKGLRDVVMLADDSTGITSVLPDGTIINSLGTAITSGLAPLTGIADWVLPENFHLLRAVGGIQVSRPRIQ